MGANAATDTFLKSLVLALILAYGLGLFVLLMLPIRIRQVPRGALASMIFLQLPIIMIVALTLALSLFL